MRSARQRAADIKLVVSATVGVIMAGLFVAVVLVVVTGDDGARCGTILAGTAEDVRVRLDDGGPYFLTGGAECGFWLALDEGDVVAYPVDQGDCTLRARGREFECDGEAADPAALSQYPIRIVTRDGIDSLVVDLRPPELRDEPSSAEHLDPASRAGSAREPRVGGQQR